MPMRESPLPMPTKYPLPSSFKILLRKSDNIQKQKAAVVGKASEVGRHRPSRVGEPQCREGQSMLPSSPLASVHRALKLIRHISTVCRFTYRLSHWTTPLHLRTPIGVKAG